MEYAISAAEASGTMKRANSAVRYAKRNEHTADHNALKHTRDHRENRCETHTTRIQEVQAMPRYPSVGSNGHHSPRAIPILDMRTLLA